MITTIQKWGNSQGVRLPKAVLDVLFLQENDPVEIVAENDTIIIKKAARKRRAKKSLEERFINYAGNYQCMEWNTGKPVGNEAW
ncbi:MAG: AbrB/MazE/SpoVT family DNA-binding domain-containing protein [Synergistaceae bacterium]|nr:AbrB/MazE/SpoVT family DNA-binding domain-containing protein [Synergistaceae bacterium]